MRVSWDTFAVATSDEQFMDLLAQLPTERWLDGSGDNFTLLHVACAHICLPAVAKLISREPSLVNAESKRGTRAVHLLARNGGSHILELLAAAGADLICSTREFVSPLENALSHMPRTEQCVRVLLANGVRLSSADPMFDINITPELREFERGVLLCRSAVVVLLRVKRTGNLWRWDKFLLREIAHAVWATRYCETWAK